MPDRVGMEPREIIDLLKRRGWILVLCVVLIPVAVYAYSDRLAKTYQASTVLQVQSTAADDPIQLGPDFSSAQQNVLAIAALIGTSGVADEASRVLKEPKGSVRGSVSAVADENTEFITVTASAASGERAAQIANAYGKAVGSLRTRQADRKVNAAIGRLQKDFRRNGADEVARTQLSEQLQRLRALRASQAGNTRVLEPAGVPGAPVSPNPKRNAFLAAVLAALLGVGLMLFAERLDRKLRMPDDVERTAGVPLLATISSDAFPGGRPGPHVSEGFQTLRDNLTYFNADETLKSLMVVSPLQGEGKTTVAINLAVSLARSGKRVILVDADLRRAQIAKRMGIETTAGLSSVLAGASLTSALQRLEPFGNHLRVLPAGPKAPNPSELLGSERMVTLLDELEREADVIVIDTTPLLVVSDAVPLLGQVSGAVALARLGDTQHTALARMLHVATSAGGRIFGVVATGAKRALPYGYGYGYETPVQAPNGAGAPDAHATNGAGETNGKARRARRKLPGRSR